MVAAILLCGLGYAEGADAVAPARRLAGHLLGAGAGAAGDGGRSRWRRCPARWSGIGAPAWVGLAYVSVFSMLVGFVFWYRGLALGGIAGVGQLQLLQPFFGLALAGLLLHEPVAWTMIAVTGWSCSASRARSGSHKLTASFGGTMTILTGLSAFPITPSDADGQVDVAALRKLVARLCAAQVHSICVLGSTGSYPYFSRAERRRALDAALDETSGRAPILAGVGALRTDETIKLAQDAKDAGAAAGLLAPVSYTPLNDEEVFEHFRHGGRESGLPLCIYDNPGTTHFRFSPALVGRLSRLAGDHRREKPGPGAVGCRRPSGRIAPPRARGLFGRLQRATGTRSRGCLPAATPGTALSPACSRVSAWPSCERPRVATLSKYGR